jgi:hypothetical protein
MYWIAISVLAFVLSPFTGLVQNALTLAAGAQAVMVADGGAGIPPHVLRADGGAGIPPHVL